MSGDALPNALSPCRHSRDVTACSSVITVSHCCKCSLLSLHSPTVTYLLAAVITVPPWHICLLLSHHSPTLTYLLAAQSSQSHPDVSACCSVITVPPWRICLLLSHHSPTVTYVLAAQSLQTHSTVVSQGRWWVGNVECRKHWPRGESWLCWNT
jgi:branched-subunit amino acid transport protein AzlD